MTDPTLHLEALAQLIDRLIAEGDPRVRERILVEEIRDRGWAEAACFLRPSRAVEGGWIETLARGPRDRLPTPEQVSAIDGGTLTGDLPLGTRALFSQDTTGPVALGLGGCGESAEDLLGSLLDVFCGFCPPSGKSAGTGPELLDLLQPPAQAPREPRPGEEEIG